MTGKPYYISLAIPYMNGKLHVGHAYEAIGGDAIARFARSEGRDVYFQCGVDEHGQKIAQAAEKAGVPTQAFVDGLTAEYENLLKVINASNNDFIRTTDQKRHWPTVQAIWQKMVDAGDIYLDTYEGWYSVRDEAYYDESELTVQPDGKKLSPQGTPVEWMKEESYFFRLSNYTDKLLNLYDSQPGFLQPASRRNETYSFVKGGLRDLSMSRTTFDWGIPVPGNDKHVMYVWVDALTNYISTLGTYTPDESLFQKYWVGAPDRIHIIGKDINRFHTVYWPAFLMSAGLPLPTTVHAHGFIYDKTGQKMSKSLGNVVDPLGLVDKFGSDAFRYFLLREVSYGQDGFIDYTQLPIRCNADLANEFGNLAQRSLSMINKNCDAQMPTPGDLTAEDEAALAAPQKVLPVLRASMDKYEIHNALAALWRVMSETNGYFAGQAPWELKKTDPARMATVLWVTANAVRQLAILAAPFIPVGTNKILDLLAVPAGARLFEHLPQHIAAGTALPAPSGVYPRIVAEEESAA